MSTNNYQTLTIGQVLALAQSENLDDNQLAARLALRLLLGVKIFNGVSTQADRSQLQSLAEVTDRDLQAQKAS